MLYEKVSPVFGGEKYLVPEPGECPHCRFVSRAIFRNHHFYYKNKSALSGAPIISVYSPASPYKVFSTDEWWSDKWDAMEYGRDFDFDRTFFEQFNELLLNVPKINLVQDGTSENCKYTNFGSQNRNCYLLVGGLGNEDSYHCIELFISKDCVDCLHVLKSEKLYECVSCEICYNSRYLTRCEQCSDSYFLENCFSCKNCLGCKNLRHKEFHIFNKPYSKEEYFRILKEHDLTTREGVEKFGEKFEKFRLELPCLFAKHRFSENSTGDFLDGAKNCHECFIVVMGAENCRHCFTIGRNCKDTIDSNGTEGELSCFSDGALNSHKVLFTHYVRSCSNIYYSMYCYNSHNLFGCTGLDRKQYCIFNKQYSKDDYEKLVIEIVKHMQKTGEWGKYFPPSLSAFGYNESFACDIFPLQKEEALAKGFKWFDYKPEIGEGEGDFVTCEITGKPFRPVRQEIEFYKKHNIPFPKVHPDVRIERRYKRRNPNKFWNRNCDNCKTEIVTTYDPGSPETVYCEECFLKEVY